MLCFFYTLGTKCTKQNNKDENGYEQRTGVLHVWACRTADQYGKTACGLRHVPETSEAVWHNVIKLRRRRSTARESDRGEGYGDS